MFIPIVSLVLYVIYRFRPTTKIVSPYLNRQSIAEEDSFMNFYNYNLYERYYFDNDIGINYLNFTDNTINKDLEDYLEDIPVFLFDPIAYPF